MKKVIITVIILISLNIKAQERNEKLLSEFKKTETKNIFGSSLIKSYKYYHKIAPIGDFLSKLWCIFGETKDYGYDGYSYVIQHIPTGIVFRAYNGMVGPSFGGFDKDKNKIDEILIKFESLLNESNYADCELIFNTDYGKMKVGAKKGKPFDIIINE